ncbi:type IVB secretion system protein IcmH/DotU [Cupriavidus necator]|uniref:Outer membrane protein n=1 Tax=Cupriavidus necator (strain ATCC 17699 / DSM 428 / KCTC 22496 / NCIMB 10442 / H16 / Stanier 337) TaxID=381666 RepID=Q0KDW1_CUPNH|nr:type VI secretion system protein TssL, long form [Cupriavidus necator]QQB77442.1 type VI secretion system protein TssL [Cupriavidus necator]CAJ91810.1 outer membrane protein [Cupriavidus necator H16]
MSKPLVSSDPQLDSQAAQPAKAGDRASPRAAAEASSQNDARKSVEQRVEEISRKANPLLAAARPLLRALADMPTSLRQDQAAALKGILVGEAKDFQAVCERANIRREHVLAAQYCLCTALDEAANGMPWGRHTWANNSLLIQLHGENDGGEKVFQLLGRLASSAAEHMDVIEVIYHILSLGFLGRYAGHADGDRQLDAIRQRLLHLISAARESVPRDLSPHWRGADAGRLSLLRTVPVWVTASVLALAVFGQFAWYKYQLLFRTHDLEQQILAIGKATPPEPPKALRLAELLKDEIARGVISVQEDATRSAVTFRGDDMFGGGRAEVSDKVLPLLDKVAGEINKVSGKVTVVGHSDNVPIKTAKYPSNQVLSEERAATVTEYLASKGVAKNRLEAIGKGDSEPLTDNKTPAARARNRRVEIVVTP